MLNGKECNTCKNGNRLRCSECLECDKKTKPFDKKPYNYIPAKKVGDNK